MWGSPLVPPESEASEPQTVDDYSTGAAVPSPCSPPDDRCPNFATHAILAVLGDDGDQ